jgi:sialate O-acetylesterase
LDPVWKFQTGNEIQWASPDFDDSQWPGISIADSWENQGYTNYDGYGWYRKTITLPDDILKAAQFYGGCLSATTTLTIRMHCILTDRL